MTMLLVQELSMPQNKKAGRVGRKPEQLGKDSLSKLKEKHGQAQAVETKTCHLGGIMGCCPVVQRWN